MTALENLGRIGGVGLFSDKIEVNVTHRTVDDIERELAKTLEMYMGQIEEVQPEKPKSIGDIDVNEELGTDEDESSTPPKS
jgi:hypothetical protein